VPYGLRTPGADTPPYNPTIMVLRAGLQGLVDCLDEQTLARGTGAISLSPDMSIYMIFGYPLHAVHRQLTGVVAVQGIADFAIENPSVGVEWRAGITPGNAHTLAPTDGVLEYLRGRKPPVHRANDTSPTAGSHGDQEFRQVAVRPWDPMGDPPQVAEDWSDVIEALSALARSRLRRHAGVLVEVLRSAQPEPLSILMAIERARSTSIRMVSARRMEALLDDAEHLVRARIARDTSAGPSG
jgi:hypothetical protein